MMAKTAMNIANVNLRTKSYEDAKVYLDKSLNIYNDINLTKGKIPTLATIGVYFEAVNKIDSCIIYYNKALYLAKEINNKYLVQKLNGSLGLAYFKNKNYELAEKIILNALNTETKPQTKAVYIERLGDIYEDTDRPDLAKKYYEQSYNIAIEIDDINLQRNSLSRLSSEYEKVGNFKTAYEYKIKQIALADSIFNLEKQTIIQGLNKKFELEKKESEKEQLSNELAFTEKTKVNSQKLFVVSSIAAFLFLLGFYNQTRKNLLKKDKISLQADKLILQDDKILLEKENNKLLSELNEELQLETSKIQELNRALKSKIIDLEEKSITLKIGKTFKNIEPNELIAVTSESNGINLILNSNSEFHYETLKNIDDQLPSPPYKSVRRGVVINTNKIKEFKGSKLELTNGMEFTITKSNSDLINYLLEKFRTEK